MNLSHRQVLETDGAFPLFSSMQEDVNVFLQDFPQMFLIVCCSGAFCHLCLRLKHNIVVVVCNHKRRLKGTHDFEASFFGQGLT